jgi:hypothetical protein
VSDHRTQATRPVRQGLHARQRCEFGTVILADGYFVFLRISATGPINGAMIDMGGNAPEQNLRPLPLPRKLPHLDP